jgi:hypothetical protein
MALTSPLLGQSIGLTSPGFFKPVDFDHRSGLVKSVMVKLSFLRKKYTAEIIILSKKKKETVLV